MHAAIQNCLRHTVRNDYVSVTRTPQDATVEAAAVFFGDDLECGVWSFHEACERLAARVRFNQSGTYQAALARHAQLTKEV